METFEERDKMLQNLYKLFPNHLGFIVSSFIKENVKVYEIRIRKSAPVCICTDRGFLYPDKCGRLQSDVKDGILLSEGEVDGLFSHICRHSVFAYAGEIKEGFLTVNGGIRIGVTGHGVQENGKILSMGAISSINIRIPAGHIHCCQHILPYLYDKHILRGCLLVSAPMRGKTTILRDLIKEISYGTCYGEPKCVGVVDERGELAGSYRGINAYDLGPNTDVLSYYPKDKGILMLVRSMSPSVIALDELGGEDDFKAVEDAFYRGCSIIATLHGKNDNNFWSNTKLCKLLEAGCFSCIVFLDELGVPGRTDKIYDNKRNILWCNNAG